MSPSRPISRVLIIDDHPIVRNGMVHLLETDEHITTAPAAASAEQGLEQLTDDIDVVVVDLKMDGLDGLAFTRLAKRTRPELPILMLSSYDETLYAEQALEAHASGYLMKRANPDQLLRAIHAIRQGCLALSASTWDRLLPTELSTPDSTRIDHPLFEVLGGTPRPPRAVAGALGVSVREASKQMNFLTRELGLTSVAQLALYIHRDDPRF